LKAALSSSRPNESQRLEIEMVYLPLSPRLKGYRGTRENLRQKRDDHNRTAYRVTDHLNRLIANDPSEMQQYIYGFIAIDLGLTTEQVRSSVVGGGYNGITLCVTSLDRERLAPFKRLADGAEHIR
jgi:hypothetical protein